MSAPAARPAPPARGRAQDGPRIREVASDPSGADARFMVERAYYKLRSQLPTAARPTRRSASA